MKNLYKIKENGLCYFGDLSKLIYTLITEKNNRKIPEFNTTFSPSDITQCPRKFFFKSKMIQGNFKSDFFKDFYVDKWLDYIDTLYGIKVIKRHVLLSDYALNLSGKLNGVIKIEDKDKNFTFAALKIRELDLDVFNEIKKGFILKEDLVEINIYMNLSDLKKGVIFYFERKSESFFVAEADLNEGIIEQVATKCKELIKYTSYNITPQKPYLEFSRECSCCQFNKKCW